MIWVALIVGIILIFIFPKQMGILAGVIGFSIAGIYLYLKTEENERKQLNDSVLITMNYNISLCSEAYPLAVSIKNGSKKIVEKVRWNINATVPGYSNNVIQYEDYISEYSTPYESDRILTPSQSVSFCYKAPKLTSGSKISSVNWGAVSKRIFFQQ